MPSSERGKFSLVKTGMVICIAGLAVSVLSLVPAVVPAGVFPWPVFAGSAIYFPGAFLAFFSSRGKERNQVFNQLRFVRLGFVAVIVIAVTSIMRG